MQKVQLYNMNEKPIENRGEIIIYRAQDNMVQLDVRMENETVWLSAAQMAQLFGKEESNIRRHIINVFRDEEVERENNVHFLHVNGVKKPVPFYSLDVILSIGYRVNSNRAIAFRQWSTKILKELGSSLEKRNEIWQKLKSQIHLCATKSQ